MEKFDKILITGANGLVGSAIVNKLIKNGYNNLLTPSSHDLNLINQKEVNMFFKKEQPTHVFFSAGKVGGILANTNFPGDFIYANTLMIFNTIQAAHENKVNKLLYLGSSCIYPKDSVQPIKENYILTGLPEETNRAYAIAKIAGIELCRSYHKQYNSTFFCLLPANIYGINDNYDLNYSHLIAALIRKTFEAKLNNTPYLTLWGSGNPRREVLNSEECADACLYFMHKCNSFDIINIGNGIDYSIKYLSETIKEIIGYKGEIKFDTSKPDGIFQKRLDVTHANDLGWSTNSNLKNNLIVVINDFINNYNNYIK